MNIVLLGEEAAGLQMLRTLARGPHRIVAVMTSPPLERSGFGSLWTTAERQGFQVWPAKRVKESSFPETVRAEQVDILLNIHSLVILPPPVLDSPRYGCFNLHPGPLPRYAGLNSVSWAIYNGERRHGVTLHKMLPGIDVGPIAYQAFFDIGDDETALAVFMRCVKEGLPLVSALLQVASESPEKIPQVPQALAERQYFGREIPNGGRIAWSAPARAIVNFVRACDYLPFPSPWGHPRTMLDAQEVAILKASRTGEMCDCTPGTVGEHRGSSVPIASSDEWVLVSDVEMGGRQLQPAAILPVGSLLG